MKTVTTTAVTSAANTATRLVHRLSWALLRIPGLVYAPARRGARGVIMVEFVLLTAAIAIPVALAFVSLGIPMLRYFRYAQMALVGPLPLDRLRRVSDDSVMQMARAMQRSEARTIVLLAVVTGAGVGCRSAQTAPAPQPRTIKLVSSLPRSSGARAQTTSIANSIRLAVGQSNGRVGDLVIDYLDWDDASPAKGDWDPDLEAANARRAIQDPDVLFYLGSYNSGAAKVSLPLLNRAGLVAISPANTYPGLTKPGACEPNEPAVYRPTGLTSYYRVVPTDDIQGRVAAEFAREKGWKTAYVLYDGGLYGQGIADIFTDTARNLGMSLLSAGPQRIDPSGPEYRALIRRIGELRPSVVYFGGTTQNNAAVIVRDLLQGVPATTKVMVPDGCYQKAFVQATGARNLEGRVYITFGGIPTDQLTGKGRRFVEDYRRAFQIDPEGYGIFGYVAAQVALEALGKAASKDREGVRQAMTGLGQVDGPLGTWQFDADGDTSLTTMSINTVKNGRFAFVARGGRTR